MTTFDLTPLFRSTVGFDRLSGLLDTLSDGEDKQFSYPPYNILKVDDNQYRIEMAIAGFSREDLDIQFQENELIITGQKPKSTHDDKTIVLHQGLSNRSFKRKFSLADHVKVQEAHMQDGLLILNLVHEVPEEAKPKKITIQ